MWGGQSKSGGWWRRMRGRAPAPPAGPAHYSEAQHQPSAQQRDQNLGIRRPQSFAVGPVSQHMKLRTALLVLATLADKGARVPRAQEQLQSPDTKVQDIYAASKGLGGRHGGGPTR